MKKQKILYSDRKKCRKDNTNKGLIGLDVLKTKIVMFDYLVPFRLQRIYNPVPDHGTA